MKHEEDLLQIAQRNWMVQNLHDSVVYLHIPNGGKRNAREAGRLKAMGVLAGASDWVIVYDKPAWSHTILWIEVKSANGKLSDKQKEFRGKVLALGCVYVTVRSVSEFINVFKEYNVPLKQGLKYE